MADTTKSILRRGVDRAVDFLAGVPPALSAAVDALRGETARHQREAARLAAEKHRLLTSAAPLDDLSAAARRTVAELGEQWHAQNGPPWWRRSAAKSTRTPTEGIAWWRADSRTNC